MRTIPLTQGKVAIVDDSDYETLLQFKWCAEKRKATWYARRSSDGKMMHRILLHLKKGEVGDHINRDGLDNRRLNLRSATVQQNNFNRRAFKNSMSGLKGVHYVKSSGNWEVKIRINGKYRCLGSFTDPQDGARRYNEEATKLFGEFAYLNPISPSL